MSGRFSNPSVAIAMIVVFIFPIVSGCGGSRLPEGGPVEPLAPPEIQPAKIVSISPSGGEPEGGEVVVIELSDFQEGLTVTSAEVRFGTEPAVVLAADASAVEVLAPAHEGVKVEVVVESIVTGQTADREEGYHYEATTAQITLVYPSVGYTDGGEYLSISHAEFQTDLYLDPPTVHFGEVEADYVRVSSCSRTIYVLTPSHPEGLVDVRVVTQDGTEKAILREGFEYREWKPRILSVLCDYGDTAGGDTITIYTEAFEASFFVHVPLVFFGSTQLDVEPFGVASIRVLTPPHPAGPIDLLVVGTGVAESAELKEGFTYKKGEPCVPPEPPPFF